MLSQRHMGLRIWSYPRRSYIVEVSSKSVQGFRRPRGSKFALFHYFGYWLLQQLVLPCKPRFWSYQEHLWESVVFCNGVWQKSVFYCIFDNCFSGPRWVVDQFVCLSMCLDNNFESKWRVIYILGVLVRLNLLYVNLALLVSTVKLTVYSS